MAVYLPIPPLEFLSNTMAGKVPKKKTSEIHFILPKLRDWVVVKEDDKILCHKKGIYINTDREHLYWNL